MSDYVPIPGYLYILYNPSFEDDTYKLGRAHDLDSRIGGYSTPYVQNSKYLYTTSVLLDSVIAENMLKEKLVDARVRSNREFYKCSLDRIKVCFNEIEAFFKENDTIEKLQVYVKLISNNIEKSEQSNVCSKWICNACNKTFAQKRNLIRHYDRCDIGKYIKADKNKDIDKEKKENEINILQLKLNEATSVIKELEHKNNKLIKELEHKNNKLIKELEQKNNEQQRSIEILQINLNGANAKNEEKDKRIEDFRKYCEYFMAGNSGTIKDLCNILKLNKESRNIPNNINTDANAPIKPTSNLKCIQKRQPSTSSESESESEEEEEKSNKKKVLTKKRSIKKKPVIDDNSESESKNKLSTERTKKKKTIKKKE